MVKKEFKYYIKYKVKGKTERIFFKKREEAYKYHRALVKGIKDGQFRENMTNVELKVIV
jgi:hypothetical protein